MISFYQMPLTWWKPYPYCYQCLVFNHKCPDWFHQDQMSPCDCDSCNNQYFVFSKNEFKTNVLGISSSDFLIWQNSKLWSTNIYYCLLSAPQSKFKTENKILWLWAVFCWTSKRFMFSVKKKNTNISTSKSKNVIKLANHRKRY